MSSTEPTPALTDAHFRALVEAQSELIALAGTDGRLLYVNPACAHQFHGTPDALLGRLLCEALVVGDGCEHMHRVAAEVLRTGQSQHVEGCMHDRAGDTRWIAWTLGVLRDGPEPLLHAVGRDVTAHKAVAQGLQESEAFARQVTDNLPQRIAYVGRDRRYQFANQALCRRFGRARGEVLGRTRDELLGQAATAQIEAAVQGVLAGQPQRLELEEAAGEAPRHFDVQLIPDTGEDGQVRGFFYTALDVTERSRAEQALRSLTHAAQRQTEVLRLVTEAIPATVVVVGSDGRYRFANSAFSAYCGLPHEHIIGRTAVEVLGPEEVARRRPFMQRAFAGESVTFALDYPGDDGPVWLALHCIPLRNTAGEMDGFVGVSQDITRERREQDRLTALSQRDPLTGLLNRAGFEHFLGSLGSERLGASLGLLYLDLDHFKPVNDQHGHPVGDRLLQLAAERMCAIVRPSDAVARLGGDEFAILLVEAGSLAHAETVAQKVVQALAEPFVVDGLTLHIGASVGVGFGLPTRGDWQALIQRADQLLYQAKRAGRGRMASG